MDYFNQSSDFHSSFQLIPSLSQQTLKKTSSFNYITTVQQRSEQQRKKLLQVRLKNQDLEKRSGIAKMRLASRFSSTPYGVYKKFKISQRLLSLSKPRQLQPIKFNHPQQKSELLNNSLNFSSAILHNRKVYNRSLFKKQTQFKESEIREIRDQINKVSSQAKKLYVKRLCSRVDLGNFNKRKYNLI